MTFILRLTSTLSILILDPNHGFLECFTSHLIFGRRGF